MYLLVALSVSQAEAQQPPSFAARADLVPVPALVRDASGNVIYGLHAEDFILEDDGVPQIVHLDEPAEAEPLSLMIALQRGRRAKREFQRIGSLASMLDPVLSNDDNEGALLLFDSRLDLVRNFTSDAAEVEGALKGLDSGDDGAAILDAIAYSARLLARQGDGRQRVLLIISETRDHGSKFTKLDDAIRLIDKNNILVFAVSFSPYLSQQLDVVRGTNKDEWPANIDVLEKLTAAGQAMKKNTPKALTSLTGGEYQLFSTQNQFQAILTAFANHLHSRYRLSFEPKSRRPGLHQIRVKLRDQGESRSVVYRSSYWAGELK